MRATSLLGLLLPAAGLLGQHDAGHPKVAAPPPVHAAHPSLPPAAARSHVREMNRQVAETLARGEALPTLPERPAGAGQFVVAAIVCADARADVARLLGLRTEDVLLISNAGACADPAAVELLERAVRDERLSLCVVLSHDGCGSLLDGGTARPRAAAAAELAMRQRMLLAEAHARLQCERLAAASPALRTAIAEGRLALDPATLGPTGRVAWHTQRADLLPLAPVR